MFSTLIFAGTFDPPHYGHIRSGIFAKEALGANEVVFVPMSEPEIITRLIALSFYRVRMLEVYIYENDREDVKVCLEELYRQGTSYTIDLVRAFMERDGPRVDSYYFLIGEDKLESFSEWANYESVEHLIEKVVVLCCDKCGKGYRYWDHHFPPELEKDRFLLMDNIVCPHVSSYQLRHLLANGHYNDKIILENVHPDVIDCVRSHKLYDRNVRED